MTYPADRMARLSSRLASTAVPTSDLYLKWSCADLIDYGLIRQITPTVFLAGKTLIVIRHDAGLNSVPAHGRLIYLMDDDWRAGIADPNLPMHYRAKIALLEARAARRLEQRADCIVATSPTLFARYQARFPSKTLHYIAPCWQPADTPLPSKHWGALSIAYFGAISHRADFHLLLPAIEILRSRPIPFTLTISGNQTLPRNWQDDPRIRLIPAMSWPQYRNWMRGQHFDIGLYPLAQTPFNAARSHNKLLEYDQFGAAMIADKDWVSGLPEEAKARCVPVQQNPSAWASAICELLTTPGSAFDIACANRDAINTAPGFHHQRAQWLDLIGLTQSGLSAAPKMQKSAK